MNIVNELKNMEEDFEWYPTTSEIFNTIKLDIENFIESNSYYYRENEPIYKTTRYDQTKEKDFEKIIIKSIVDVGAGDGRFFSYFDEDTFEIGNKLAVEKSEHLAKMLMAKEVFLIGRDFFKLTLVDKFYSIIFSNPPYSIYEEWVEKILLEGNASFIYLVIPQRWKNNNTLVDLIKEKGEYTILDTFDFLNAERKARCTVDVLKIKCNFPKNDFTKSFNSWIETNIGKFEAKDIEEPVYQENILIDNNENKISQLVINYQKDMESLISVYQSLARIDFKLLRQIGLNKESLFKTIKEDIINLKQKYWNIAFSFLEPIQARLTYESRQDLLKEIQKFGGIDFNEDNVYNIVLWVIQHFNKNSQNQLLKLFEKLTDFEGVLVYKSNERWFKGEWRYNNKDMPEKYKLDYRIVTRMYKREYDLGWDIKKENTLIHDILIVMESLGFIANNRFLEFRQDGKSHSVMDDKGNLIFSFRYYQNSNVHIKFNQELMLKFNIEVGKLKGWLSSPKDVQNEFDLDEEEATKYFVNSQINYLSKKTLLLT